jgi:Iron/zinc purple acid phosphatase-like protein C
MFFCLAYSPGLCFLLLFSSSQPEKTYDNPRNPVHIMAGAAGDIEGSDPWIAYSVVEPRWTAFRYVSPAWVDRYDWAHNGYGVATFHNATAMTWEFYSAVTNKVVDSMQLTKQR